MTGSRPLLLLVDDEAFILAALRRVLRNEGYQMLTADTAQAALELLDQHSVDLIVSDQKMPGTSGIDFLAEVAERHPAIPRILLSGWPEEIPEARLAALGVRALLPKPWDDAELKRTLRESLGLPAEGDPPA